MVPILLSALADAAPVAATAPETTRWSIAVAAEVAAQSSTYGDASAGSTSSGARSNGNAGVTLYLRDPVVDDDSPRSLQPFLQRTSVLSFDGGALYEHAGYSPAAGGGSYTQYFTPESITARVFVHPQIAILGAAGLDYLHDTYAPDRGVGRVRDLWEPWGSVGLDARAGDGSLSLQWQLVDVDQTIGASTAWRSVFWPRVSLAGRIVLSRRYDLSATATLIPDGVQVRAGFAAYPTRDLGLSLFAQVNHGQIYWDSSTDYDSVLGGPAVSYWLSGRTALALSYSPTWVSSARTTSWRHPVTLTLTVRLP